MWVLHPVTVWPEVHDVGILGDSSLERDADYLGVYFCGVGGLVFSVVISGGGRSVRGEA